MKWGAQFDKLGFTATPTNENFGHTFGGQSYRIQMNGPSEDSPTLLLSLDLSADELASMRGFFGSCLRLPIVSFVNSDAWTNTQEYVFGNHDQTIEWKTDVARMEMQNPEDRLPNPLPERRMKLSPMDSTDLPLQEEGYWRIGDDFLGGKKFIRIFGSPYWLQDEVIETCPCHKSMICAVSLGYELPEQAGLFCEKPFFIGEAALYFFVCFDCRRVRVVWQST